MLLIAYASKSGTAKEAAERLADLLPSAKLVDLTLESPTITGFDEVIIGSGVRMGSIHKAAKEFAAKNKDVLASRKIALFITNSFIDASDEVIAKGFPEELRNCALWCGSLGGRLDAEKLKGLDKAIAKAVSKAVKEGTPLNEDINAAALQDLASRFQ